MLVSNGEGCVSVFICVYSFVCPSACLQNKLPKVFELDRVRKQLGTELTPQSVVLLQELERFNKLIKKMSSSLSSLQKVSVLHVASTVSGPSCPGNQ